MFTGIVEELGTVAAVEDQGDAIRLTINAATVLEGTGLGDSIAVNGVSAGSKAWASTPWRCNAASTRLPLLSDTSRSADEPPNSTATLPRDLGLIVPDIRLRP